MREADGIILGSPVYFSDITPVLKALIDRSGRVGRAELKSYLLGIGAQIPRGFEPGGGFRCVGQQSLGAREPTALIGQAWCSLIKNGPPRFATDLSAE